MTACSAYPGSSPESDGDFQMPSKEELEAAIGTEKFEKLIELWEVITATRWAIVMSLVI